MDMEKLIFRVPEFVPGQLFSREVLTFLGVILLLIVGVMIALLGHRCLKTMLFLLLGAIGGAAGYLIAERLTAQAEIHLIFFVIFCVVGWVFLAAINGFIVWLGKRAKVYNFFQAVTPYFTALLGAAIVFFVVWRFVYDDLKTALGVGIFLLVAGCVIGALRYRKRRGFFTYEDLMHRPMGLAELEKTEEKADA